MRSGIEVAKKAGLELMRAEVATAKAAAIAAMRDGMETERKTALDAMHREIASDKATALTAMRSEVALQKNLASAEIRAEVANDRTVAIEAMRQQVANSKSVAMNDMRRQVAYEKIAQAVVRPDLDLKTVNERLRIATENYDSALASIRRLEDEIRTTNDAMVQREAMVMWTPAQPLFFGLLARRSQPRSPISIDDARLRSLSWHSGQLVFAMAKMGIKHTWWKGAVAFEMPPIFTCQAGLASGGACIIDRPLRYRERDFIRPGCIDCDHGGQWCSLKYHLIVVQAETRADGSVITIYVNETWREGQGV